MFAFRSVCTLHGLPVLRRQTLQLLLETLHHVKQENCTLLVLFQEPRCPDPPDHEVSLEEMKAQKEDRLPDLRVLRGLWSQWFCRELCRPIYSCSSK